jgi:hypothetical protein
MEALQTAAKCFKYLIVCLFPLYDINLSPITALHSMSYIKFFEKYAFRTHFGGLIISTHHRSQVIELSCLAKMG